MDHSSSAYYKAKSEADAIYKKIQHIRACT